MPNINGWGGFWYCLRRAKFKAKKSPLKVGLNPNLLEMEETGAIVPEEMLRCNIYF